MTDGWAVVTGASSGIGAAFAVELGRRGHPVALVGRCAERLASVAREIGTTRTFAVDLGATGSADDLEEFLAREHVSLLVNNAGSAGYGPFVEQQAELSAQTVAVNLTAVLRLSRAVLPAMIARGSGGIVNVSSSASDMSAPGAAVYAASKAAVDSFSRSLRREVRGHGVVVTCVRPGFTRTRFHERSGSADGPQGGRWQDPAVVAVAALRAHDAGRAVLTVPRYGVLDWLRRHSGDLDERAPAPVIRLVKRVRS